MPHLSCSIQICCCFGASFEIPIDVAGVTWGTRTQDETDFVEGKRRRIAKNARPVRGGDHQVAKQCCHCCGENERRGSFPPVLDQALDEPISLHLWYSRAEPY